MLKVCVKANERLDVIAPLIAEVQRVDRPLADQLRRAVQSVVLNLAEGENVTRGNQRVHFERAATRQAPGVVFLSARKSATRRAGDLSPSIAAIASRSYSVPSSRRSARAST